jgi:peptidoglycan/xylan/chitin deacetylase (PgdA/CDA1 family)
MNHPLTIVTYHAVVRRHMPVYDWCFLQEELFIAHLQYLQHRFNVIALSEAVDRLESDRLDRPYLVLTFDDGFQNIRDVAFPHLGEAGLPAAVFPVTSLIDTDETLWYCRLNHALAETRETSLEWDGRCIDLSTPDARVRANVDLQASLKEFPHPSLLSKLEHVLEQLRVPADVSLSADSPYRMASAEALDEMVASGLIELGAHTHSHAILSLLPPESAREEIDRSLTVVRTLTGGQCPFFAYPNGGLQDYNASTIEHLASRGLHAALTMIPGLNDAHRPRLELKRYGIGANHDLRRLTRLLSSVPTGAPGPGNPA